MNSPSAAGTAGFLATIPMTVAMELLHRQLPAMQQQPLPPKQITERAAAIADVEEGTGTGQWDPMTLASHFSYGTTVGSFYGPLRQALPFSPAVRGALFGLGVWAGSYFGLLPALRLYPSAKDESAERNSLMIAAHLIWGASLGALTEYLSPENEERG